MDIIGLNIKRRRKALRLNQEELAEATGLTIQAITRIETGKRQARKSNLEAIAKALGCEAADLYKDESKRDETQIDMAAVISKQATQIEALKSHPLLSAWENAKPQTRLVVMDLLGMIENPAPLKDAKATPANYSKKKALR